MHCLDTEAYTNFYIFLFLFFLKKLKRARETEPFNSMMFSGATVIPLQCSARCAILVHVSKLLKHLTRRSQKLDTALPWVLVSISSQVGCSPDEQLLKTRTDSDSFGFTLLTIFSCSASPKIAQPVNVAFSMFEMITVWISAGNKAEIGNSGNVLKPSA